MLTDRAFVSEGESRMSPKTGQVSLRTPVPADADARAALGISAAINRMYGFVSDTPDVMTGDRAERWLQRLLNHPNAWIIEEDSKLAGEVRLDTLNADDRRARLAIGMFHERHLGRGIGRKVIDLVLQQAFGPLGLHRVDLRVLSFNIRAIRCYEACGFRLEGIERESALVGGEWHDDWIMAILEQDFRPVRPGERQTCKNSGRQPSLDRKQGVASATRSCLVVTARAKGGLHGRGKMIRPRQGAFGMPAPRAA